MTIKYALIVALVLTALACGQAPATSPTQDVRTPTPAPLPTSHFAAQRPTPIALPNLKVVDLGSDFWPTDLSGDRVVGIGRDGEVYLANVRTGKTRQLTNDGYRKRQPVISGDTVAWTDQSRGVETHDSNSRTARGLADDIFVLDLNTGDRRRITEAPAKRSGLKISGKRLVWLDNRNEFGEHYTHRDIYAYDLEADEEIAVAVAAGAQHWVAIEGDRVVWVDNRNSAILGTDRSGCFQCPDNRFDIYLYDFTTGEELVLDDSGANNTMPDIHGDRVVWRDFDDDGRTTIRLFDLDTGERRYARLTETSAESTGPSYQATTWCGPWDRRATYLTRCLPAVCSTGAFAHDLRTGEVKRLSNYVEPSITLDGTVVVIHEACQVGGRVYAVFLGPDADTGESAGSEARDSGDSVGPHTPTPAPIPTATGTSAVTPAPSVTSPAPSPTVAPTPVDLAARRSIEDVIRDPMARIADRAPGFGGAFRDSGRNIVYIYLQDASMLEEAERVLTEEFGADFLEGSEVRVLEGDYSMAHLADWNRALNEVIWQVPGITLTDLDEGKNRIEIVMQPRRGAREEMEAAIASVDVPRGAVVIDVGCEGVNPWPLDNGNPPGEAFLRAIDYSLEVEDQVSYGESVQMKLRLRNVSEEPIDLYLGGRPPHYFVVSTPDGEQVWHGKCAKFTLTVLEMKSFEPGEELEFTGEWEQVDNRGEPVPPGTYLVRGILNMDPPEKLVTEARELGILR